MNGLRSIAHLVFLLVLVACSGVPSSDAGVSPDAGAADDSGRMSSQDASSCVASGEACEPGARCCTPLVCSGTAGSGGMGSTRCVDM